MMASLITRHEKAYSLHDLCHLEITDQLDLYWWTHYGGLHRKAKERRRQAHQGNCALIRYADGTPVQA
jgi:hypothetical protein